MCPREGSGEEQKPVCPDGSSLWKWGPSPLSYSVHWGASLGLSRPWKRLNESVDTTKSESWGSLEAARLQKQRPFLETNIGSLESSSDALDFRPTTSALELLSP